MITPSNAASMQPLCDHPDRRAGRACVARGSAHEPEWPPHSRISRYVRWRRSRLVPGFDAATCVRRLQFLQANNI
jgi:hypothetical protein